MNNNLQLIAQIDAILPQTQCTRCGYPSCPDYAKAVANLECEINRCTPGGDEVIDKLAQIMHKAPMALAPECNTSKPRQIAKIIEEDCIGCTLCIKSCPVDAIVGSNKMIHTVIAHECSGCDLCVPACPVDCIDMIDDPLPWTIERKHKARERFDNRKQRSESERVAREQRLRAQQSMLLRVINQK